MGAKKNNKRLTRIFNISKCVYHHFYTCQLARRTTQEEFTKKKRSKAKIIESDRLLNIQYRPRERIHAGPRARGCGSAGAGLKDHGRGAEESQDVRS